MGRRPMMPVNSTSGVHEGLKEGCWAQFQGQYFTCRHETCGQDLPGDYRGPDLRMVIPFAEAPVEWWYRTLPRTGPMIGWKRIVVTVGEKIGKEHLTYGQGAAAEITAMFTNRGLISLFNHSVVHVLIHCLSIR